MLGIEALRMAFATLWSHKGRSILTIIGVVIGVSSVLAVTSLGQAFEESITSQFDAIDDRAILVTAGTGNEQGPPDAGPFGLIFTERDRQNLLAIDGVEGVSAAGSLPVTGLTHGETSIAFERVTATTPDAGEVRDASEYSSGAVFTPGAREAVLGSTIARLLGQDVPLVAGDEIIIEFPDRSERVTVAGVLSFQDSLFGSSNREVFVPVDPFYDQGRTSPSTGQRTLVYQGFTVFARDVGSVGEVKDDVRTYFDTASDANKLLTEDVQILVATASDITSQISDTFGLVTLFIGAIAGVSLMVGGIMIATIMLISVAERTREIGMMKAIGARDRDVLWMILLEAALIGIIGSAVGIGIGLGGGAALTEGLFGGEDISFIIPWDWLGISVGVGVLTGVLGGIIPARRATRVQPVAALGYE